MRRSGTARDIARSATARSRSRACGLRASPDAGRDAALRGADRRRARGGTSSTRSRRTASARSPRVPPEADEPAPPALVEGPRHVEGAHVDPLPVPRGRETDLELLYACIEPSIASKEFFLRKAIGWALREYAHTDMREVARYVKKNDSRLSGLSKREALKHADGRSVARILVGWAEAHLRVRGVAARRAHERADARVDRVEEAARRPRAQPTWSTAYVTRSGFVGRVARRDRLVLRVEGRFARRAMARAIDVAVVKRSCAGRRRWRRARPTSRRTRGHRRDRVAVEIHVDDRDRPRRSRARTRAGGARSSHAPPAPNLEARLRSRRGRSARPRGPRSRDPTLRSGARRRRGDAACTARRRTAWASLRTIATGATAPTSRSRNDQADRARDDLDARAFGRRELLAVDLRGERRRPSQRAELERDARRRDGLRVLDADLVQSSSVTGLPSRSTIALHVQSRLPRNGHDLEHAVVVRARPVEDPRAAVDARVLHDRDR